MLNFAANLSFLFPSLPFSERFSAAAAAGFRGCEFLFPYDYLPEEIGEFLRKPGLTQALFNLPPGDWMAGDRGIAALPGREAEFVNSVETALRYADFTDCRQIHIMAGCADAGSDENRDRFLENLTHATNRFRETGITAMIEPINPFDMPGYFLTEIDQALEIIGTVGAKNLRLQFDCYHRAMMGKGVVEGLERAASVLGHVQIAGFPGRNEPSSGALNYVPIFEKLVKLNYTGWIGCEYHPAGKTTERLDWRACWD